ncbi:MAG: shikimate kinase [Actinobacteria bacterium]|nr:shikimate kinase [Actinomycetota bacterium]
MVSGDASKMIVLIGLMGSGKTTVGRALAERLNLVFRDSDEAVEKTAKTSVREIFEIQGEDVFRKLESQALVDLCEESAIVLAVAGGAIISQSNRALLQKNARCIVWLDAPTPTLISRTGRGKHRPLLDGDPVGSLNKMRLDREPLYQQLATHHLVTQSLSIVDVVDKIISLCSLENSSTR